MSRLALVTAALLAALPAEGAEDPPAWSFPERSPQPLPDFYPAREKDKDGAKDGERAREKSGERAKAAVAERDRRDVGSERPWFAEAALGLELVQWQVAAGSAAFPRYRTSEPPSYPSDASRLHTETWGYDDVPDGSLPACATLQGGLVLAPGWRVGLRYGYSRSAGPEIAVSHHRLDLGTTIHPFQPWIFLHAGVGRALLVFADEAGSDVYSRFTWTLGVGGTVPLRTRFALPVALEFTKSLAGKDDSGLPSWSALRVTAGVALR